MRKQKRPLKNIADAITDNIINTPDNEILEEDKGGHDDAENKMRDIINRAKIQVKKKKDVSDHVGQTLALFGIYQKKEMHEMIVRKKKGEKNV